MTKEQELKEVLRHESMDIMFLTETDTRRLVKEDSYLIEGYKTVLPLKKENDELVRIVCLVKDHLLPFVKIRKDLMSNEFPSIWIDFNPDAKTKPVRLAGFYRVWTQDGCKNTESQRSNNKKGAL